MKNPNGYGSVFKLTGNRRKPWCARVTVGWTDDFRYTTATLLDNAGVDRTIVKLILGYAGNDVTERVYAHKTPE